MKLYLEDDENGDAIQYLPDNDTPPPDFTITVDPKDWNHYIDRIDADYIDVRNEMIDHFEPNWATNSDDQNKALIENYIWPSETSTDELDNLYDPDERKFYQEEVMGKINISFIHVIKSPTSTKHFVVSIDDTGALINPLPQIKTDTKI